MRSEKRESRKTKISEGIIRKLNFNTICSYCRSAIAHSRLQERRASRAKAQVPG